MFDLPSKMSQDMSELLAFLGEDDEDNDEETVAIESSPAAELLQSGQCGRRLVDLDSDMTYKGPSLSEMMGGPAPTSKILPGDLSSSEDESEKNPEGDELVRRESSKQDGSRSHSSQTGAGVPDTREKVQRIAPAPRALLPSSSQRYGAPFDAFFGLPTVTPKVSPTTFQTYAEGMQKVKIMQAKRRVGVKGDWITMGVIVDRSDVKKSSNGKEYMVWNMTDLYDCQQKPVKVLLFADCVRDHWKIQLGTLVALTNADCDTDGKTGDVTVKLFKSNQVMEIGQCPLFSHCKASKKDGERCKSFVNLSISDHCAFHIQSTANRLASRRGTFNTGIAAMPKKLFEGKPLGDFSNYFYQGKMVQAKSQPLKPTTPTSSRPPIDAPQPKGLYVSEPQIRNNEKKALNQIISSGNIHHRGARNLIALRNKTSYTQLSSSSSTNEPAKPLNVKSSPPQAAKPKCLTELKVDCSKKAALAAARPPMLGRSFQGNQMISLASPKKKPKIMTKEEIVKQRAINLIKRQGGIQKVDPNAVGKPKKRPVSEPNEPGPSTSSGVPAKKSCLGGSKFSKEELMALIKKKSSHEDEVNQENAEKQNTYFNAMEVKERVETSAVDLKEIKNCNVVTCKTCSYTSHKQSDYCKMQGHAVVRHKADKRWYKCRGCSSRLICYELMPTRPCQRCGGTDFQRVGMKDERRVPVQEKLLVRGVEQKFL
uniref:Protein MCM10 homolog n=1 Tax=Steinernema glaseri TaxID=37863 RepID=A0A1I7ZMR3_9BILA